MTRDAKGKKKRQTSNDYYCDNSCTWRSINDPLPDIVPNPEWMVHPTFLMQWKIFDSFSCAFGEKCIFGFGNRLILRFNTDIINMGNAPYVGTNLYERPDINEYAACHQHYHMRGFARFNIKDLETGMEAVKSAKQSYCVEATVAYQEGPAVPCTSTSDCGNQGLEIGWLDRYDRYLDCQWLDITNLVETSALNKWYEYFIAVNNGRPIVEYSFLNNHVEFSAFLPCPPDVRGYYDLTTYYDGNRTVCCSRPEGTGDLCPAPGGGCASVPAPSTSTCSYTIPPV